MNTTIRPALVHEISGWVGVQVSDSDRSALQFHYGRVELGHVHGATVAHLPFPRRLRDSLIASGHATSHPMFPESGWVERRITGPEDLARVIDLFRMNYDRARSRATPDMKSPSSSEM